jgi:hypothetical protein
MALWAELTSFGGKEANPVWISGIEYRHRSDRA